MQFREVAADSGVRFTYRNGDEANHSSILESLGGGVALFDFDGDEWPDALFPGGGGFRKDLSTAGLPTALFRNLGDWKFAPIADSARIASVGLYTHGASCGDYDNDGFADVLITGYGGVRLWHNQGDGTFVESQESVGLHDKLWSSSAAWGDLNGDGALDLYVAHYVDWSPQKHPYCSGPTPQQREICPPRSFDGLPDVLYFSNGDGTFRDGSTAAGLRTDAASKGLGVLLADFDLDGDLDIYVANDTTENFLYLNDGKGKFTEEGIIRGVALDDAGIANGSMGVDLIDFNRDGRPDLWVANYERESFALYRNEGRGQFLHVSQATGVTALGGLFVGFGTACADLDRDGDEDVLVANGHVIKFPVAAKRRQLPLALENQSGRFHRLAFQAGDYFSTAHEGRGLSLSDLDNDGDLDAVVSHLNDPVALLLNDTRTKNQWLAVRLIGRDSNRNAIGVRLMLHTSAGDQFRQIKGGGSYLSQGTSHAYFGVPKEASATRITIDWPSGAVQNLDQIGLNRRITAIEPGRD